MPVCRWKAKPLTDQIYREYDMTKYLKIGIKFFENQSAIFVIILTGILLIPNALARANWPGFRGPTGLGYTTEENLPIAWGGKGQTFPRRNEEHLLHRHREYRDTQIALQNRYAGRRLPGSTSPGELNLSFGGTWLAADSSDGRLVYERYLCRPFFMCSTENVHL